MPPNATATAEQAAATLVDQLRAHIAGQPADLDSARNSALQVVAAERFPDAAADIDQAVSDALSRYQAAVQVHGEPAARQMASGALWCVEAAVERALHEFSQRADLSAAEHELSAAGHEQARRVGDLDAAVHVGDLARVSALRAETEIAGPARIDQARRRVLGLQLAEAEEQAALLRGLWDREKTAIAQRTEAVLEAHRQAEEAGRALSEAESREAQAKYATQRAAGRVAELRAAAERLAAEQERQHRARVRRLAGLPEPRSDAPAAPEPEPRFVLASTEYTTH